MPRITSWLKKPLMVLVAVVLVILGAGTAHAETTPPPSATAVTAAIIEVPLPEAPPTNDPCNPVGVTTNIDWAGDLPASDEYVLWTENAAGTARTASLRDTANTTWSDSTVSPKTFRLVDSGVACEVPLIKVTAVNGTFADECGPDFNLSFTPAVTAGVKYVEVRDGNTIKVTPDVTDPAKYELTNPEWSQTATDQLVACEVPLIKVTAVNGTFADECGPDFNLSFTPAVTAGVKYVEVRDGNTIKVTPDVTDPAKYELTNPEWSQTATDQLVACEVPLIKVTAVNGTFADECGPDFNLSFTPAVTAGVKYVEVRDGNTIKVTPDVTDPAKYELTNPEWSQTATDQLVACEVPLIKVTAVNGTFADECGPDFNLSFTPAVTAGVKYVEVRDGNTIKVTPDVTDPAKYELTNPEWSQTATDQLVACDIVQTKAFVCKYVGMGANERLQTGNNPIMIDRKDDMVIGSFFGDAQKRSVVIGFGNPGDPDMPISACPAPPETPDPVVTVTTESRDNCELGYVQTRTVTTTRSYAWQGTDGWVLGDPVVSYGEWVNTDTPATGCEVLYLELAPLTVTATCGAVTFTNPAGNPAVAVYYGDFTQEAPDGSVVVMPGKSVTVKTERTSLDGIVFAEGYYDLVFEDVVVEQKCATPVDPEPPVKPKPPVVAKPQPPAQPSEWVDTDDLVKPIIDAGVDTPATVTPMEAGSVFGTTAASIAMATLLMLSVALAWRQRSKLAAVFTRR